MGQELLTLPEHLSSPPVFSGVRVTRSLVLCVCFVDRCLYFFFLTIVLSVLLRYTDSDYLPLVYCGHCVVCSSAIYGFWLPLWYLQTLLNEIKYPTQKTKDRETKPNYLCALMNIIIYILPSVCNFIKRSLEARIWGSHWSNHIKHNIVFYQTAVVVFVYIYTLSV